MKTPKPIENLINSFKRLPGIGPKTAQRLAFYLLRFPQEELENFGDYLKELKIKTKLCSVCKNIDDRDPCSICSDPRRNKYKIIVTASPMDVYAIEKVGYDGVYHVLHGVINPLDNIGPEELYIKDLIDRLKEIKNSAPSEDSRGHPFGSKLFSKDKSISDSIEIVLATNSNMEGESTAMYIAKKIREEGFSEDEVRITRIARGLPVGGDIEYADDITLTRALEGRVDFK